MTSCKSMTVISMSLLSPQIYFLFMPNLVTDVKQYLLLDLNFVPEILNRGQGHNHTDPDSICEIGHKSKF